MGRFFEVFPHKARSIGGEAVPKRRDDYATGESKRCVQASSCCARTRSLRPKRERRVKDASFSFSIAAVRFVSAFSCLSRANVRDQGESRPRCRWQGKRTGRVCSAKEQCNRQGAMRLCDLALPSRPNGSRWWRGKFTQVRASSQSELGNSETRKSRLSPAFLLVRNKFSRKLFRLP